MTDECTKVRRDAVHLPETCAKQIRTVFTSPPPWGRGLLNRDCLSPFLTHSAYELQMRRKAEVLEYKNHTASRMKRTTHYANVVNNRYRYRSREVCATPARIEAPSSASGVPGRQTLWLDKRVPYLPIKPRITYADEPTVYL
jgi:hypothetical protein